jgi:hypothetical protein
MPHTEIARWKIFRLPGDASGHHRHLTRRDQGEGFGPLTRRPPSCREFHPRHTALELFPLSFRVGRSSSSMGIHFDFLNAETSSSPAVCAGGFSTRIGTRARHERPRLFPGSGRRTKGASGHDDANGRIRQFAPNSVPCVVLRRNPLVLFDLRGGGVQSADVGNARRAEPPRNPKIFSRKGVDTRPDLPYRCAPVRKERALNKPSQPT